MRLNILAFGITKDIIGNSTIDIEIASGTSVAELKDVLYCNYPAMKELKSLLIAINEEYGEDDYQLKERDEIALIPPVSGG